ncbi:hypothetical protein RUM43_009271 [Polyplax serrata]|uniref:Uncharacterized protein n=1 Tax=Polyplax serrata TaxID=468196 RepID=A0AAN8RUA2_POLSC
MLHRNNFNGSIELFLHVRSVKTKKTVEFGENVDDGARRLPVDILNKKGKKQYLLEYGEIFGVEPGHPTLCFPFILPELIFPILPNSGLRLPTKRSEMPVG